MRERVGDLMRRRHDCPAHQSTECSLLRGPGSPLTRNARRMHPVANPMGAFAKRGRTAAGPKGALPLRVRTSLGAMLSAEPDRAVKRRLSPDAEYKSKSVNGRSPNWTRQSTHPLFICPFSILGLIRGWKVRRSLHRGRAALASPGSARWSLLTRPNTPIEFASTDAGES